MNLLPRSLFGRLVLLLVTVVALAAATSAFLFRLDRAQLLNRAFSETKLAQLQAIRAALEGADGAERRETLGRLNREYGVRIVPEGDRPAMGQPADGPLMREVGDRLRERLGPETEIRFLPRLQMLLVKVNAAGRGYWIGVPMPPRPPGEEATPRGLIWLLAVLAALLVAAFFFARWAARPLRELSDAVTRVGRGETAPVLPETGPTEIAAVNRGFNAMTENLQRMERERALLLAGVSHDLRTPLARLRLGIEMGGRDDAMRGGMVADIEEMDRIIGQFLDFARENDGGGRTPTALETVVAGVVDRYTSGGAQIAVTTGVVPLLSLNAAALSRLLANLLDNALAYGTPPVSVTTAVVDGAVRLEVGDRGSGVAPADVERLKQPFTRASVARARADGAAGAGLGLAIVDRIARLHGGRFDLLPRDGGGTLARVTLPLPV